MNIMVDKIDRVLILLSAELNRGRLPEDETTVMKIAEDIDALREAKSILKRYDNKG